MTTPSDDRGATTIRALVVDDEELGRRNLCLALADHRHWHVVAEASSVAAAEIALGERPDIEVVFLDIRMPRGSGLDLARTLSRRESPPWIVFVTAYDAHAIEAFDLHALDYLLKPFSDQRLAQALARVEDMVRLRQRAAFGSALRGYVEDEERQRQPGQAYWQTIGVRSVGRIDTVSLAEVLRIEAQGNYAELHLAERRLLFRASMTQLVQHLDPAVFLRVHRGTIVRRDQAQALVLLPGGSHELRMRDGSRVGVSERHLAAVKAALRTG